jgi:hypothetical protein
MPVLDVSLDLHRMSLHADERDGVCAGEPHLAHPPQMLDREVT